MSAIASVTEVELSKDLQVRSTLHVLLWHPEGMQHMPCTHLQQGDVGSLSGVPSWLLEQPLLRLPSVWRYADSCTASSICSADEVITSGHCIQCTPELHTA